MKNTILAAEDSVRLMPISEAPSPMVRDFEFLESPVRDLDEVSSSMLDDLKLPRASVQDFAVDPVPWSAPLVQVHQNNYSFYFGRSMARPSEELRVVQAELETAIRKLTYEDDDDEGFLPSTRSRQRDGFASAHATAHALRRTNEALRALTNAVHLLHSIETKKYAA